MRDYGVAGQLGVEPTMEAYLDDMMAWVNEIWRILKPSGSFVLNLGDTYCGGWPHAVGKDTGREAGMHPGHAAVDWAVLKQAGTTNWKANSTPRSVQATGARYYKDKMLLLVSSFAYCRIVSETDFVLRNEEIWCKPNVPSPHRSRRKHSHEKLFWFVKDADKVYWDPEPWMRDVLDRSTARGRRAPSPDRAFAETLGLGANSTLRAQPRSNAEQVRYMRDKAQGAKVPSKEASREVDSPHTGQLHNVGDTSCFKGGNGDDYLKNTRTIEHSWRIVPVGEKQRGFELDDKPVSEHIAPYPTKLIRPYIQSLAPPLGIVLDPFLGSGTTMRVAMEEGRSCIGVEINPSYIAYAKKRVNWGGGLDVEYVG